MKTADKAAMVVAEFLNGNDVTANTITERLADAGLLAPDLPESEDNTFLEYEDCTVWAAPRRNKVRLEVTDSRFTPDEAREVAHALLAAANHAEGNQ